MILFSYFPSREECSSRGGANGGSCASGFGVCCICKYIWKVFKLLLFILLEGYKDHKYF